MVQIVVVLGVGCVALYLSQFWGWRLWSGQGLFGVRALRPGGDLVSVWLRGTPLAPFSLLVWGVGLFLTLSLVERLLSRLFHRD